MMYSVFKKVVAAGAVLSLLAASCISGYAAKITQDTNFTVQDATDGTGYRAKVGVKNGLADKQSFMLLTAVYSADEVPILTDVDLTSCEIAGNTEKQFYTGNAVSVDEDSTVKVFLWDSELSPLESGSDLRTLHRHATLSAVKVGDYATVVDNEAKTVYVDTNEDISEATVSNVVASDGASCEVAASNASITVTSEDGLATTTYKILASDKLTVIDFEDGDVSDWTLEDVGGKSGTSIMKADSDPLNDANKVLILDDKVTTDRLHARYNLDAAIDAPFVVSYKVMYDRDTNFDDNGASITGTWLHARGTSGDIISLGSQDSGSVQAYNIKSKVGENQSNKTFELATWHEMKMVCLSEDEARFYVDGEEIMLVKDGETQIAKPINFTGVNRLQFFSSDRRTCTVYFDDICVRPYDTQEATLERVTFAGSNGNAIDGYIHEDAVYVNAASLDGFDMTEGVVANDGTAVYDSDAATITTTTADGRATYQVVAREYFEDDFSLHTAEEAPNSENYTVQGTGSDTDAENGSISVTVEEEAANKFLQLYDSNGDSSKGFRAQAQVRNTLETEPKSFIVEYKQRLSHLPTDEPNSGANNDRAISNFVKIRNSSNKDLAFMQSTNYNATTDIYTMTSLGTGIFSTVTRDSWNTIKIVYTTSADATSATIDYYLNGKHLGQEAATNVGTFNRLYISTSTTRLSVLSIDDIKIIPLD